MAIVGLCLAGCTSMNMRGDEFQHDPALELGRQMRVPDRQGEFFGFSNKARQIEGNVGLR